MKWQSFMCVLCVYCRIVLRFEGDSLDRESSPDRLIDIMMENKGKLNYQVSSVHSGMSPISQIHNTHNPHTLSTVARNTCTLH